MVRPWCHPGKSATKVRGSPLVFVHNSHVATLTIVYLNNQQLNDIPVAVFGPLFPKADTQPTVGVVEMGGFAPPSRKLGRRYTTSLSCRFELTLDHTTSRAVFGQTC